MHGIWFPEVYHKEQSAGKTRPHNRALVPMTKQVLCGGLKSLLYMLHGMSCFNDPFPFSSRSLESVQETGQNLLGNGECRIGIHPLAPQQEPVP